MSRDNSLYENLQQFDRESGICNRCEGSTSIENPKRCNRYPPLYIKVLSSTVISFFISKITCIDI